SFPNGVRAVATMTDRLMLMSVTTRLRATAARRGPREAAGLSCPAMSTGGDAELLRRLQLVTDAALSRLDLNDLLAELLTRIRDVLEADTAAVLLRDEFRNELVARAAVGLEEEA